jgi:hypothetical protein
MMSMEQWWSDTDRGKAEVGGENPAPLPLLSLKIVTYIGLGSNSVLRGERLNHDAAFENWCLCYVWDCVEGF